MTSFDRSAVDLARAIRERETTAVAATEACLARVDASHEKLNALITVDRDGALATASEVDRAIAAGETVGPLAGVPMVVKDIFATRGLRTTCGSRILHDWTPPYEGTAIKRLRAAGAVFLGKANMDEFAMGSSNEASAFGACKNPWDTDRVPGGSSGGCAAAVAARLCPAALGTDTGGSIRQPASLCGVVGFKPTYGRVSRYGVIAFASSLDQVGPIAGTVEDCAALLEVISGHDPKDATSLPEPVGVYTRACQRPASNLRIGLPKEYFGDGVDPEVANAVEQAVRQLGKLGAQVHEVSLPHTRYAVATYYLICMAEASSNLARYDGVRFGHRTGEPKNLSDMYRRTRGEGFGPEVKRRIILGTFALSAGYYDAYYGKAQRVRSLIRSDFQQAFETCDLLATPATPAPAFRVGEKIDDPLQMYLADVFTVSCNLAGLPGLAIPCGFSRAGLPIGLQLLGPPLGEETLCSAGAAFQRATDWHTRVPTIEAG